ncbi:MAG: Uma2 family endonuclease [Cyanobacteria bacterium P01_H01_bin.121]
MSLPANGNQDYEIKPNDYAAVGVAEYWVLDPDANQAFIYVLADTSVYESAQVSKLAGLNVAELQAVIADGKRRLAAARK